MDVFIPVSNVVFGYTQSSKIGMGEDFKMSPNSVEIGAMAGYIKTAFGKTVKPTITMGLTLPAMWVNAPDDDILNDKECRRLWSVFPTLQATTQTLQPKIMAYSISVTWVF